MNKKSIIQIIIGVIIILLITIGISFAYFTANIHGAEDTTTITVSGGVMNISYNVGANINLSNIAPQNEALAANTFTVTGNNTTGLEMLYNISFIVDINTFSYESLKYKLISTNSGGNGTTVPSITTMEDIGRIIYYYKKIF